MLEGLEMLDREFYLMLEAMCAHWEAKGVPINEMVADPEDKLAIYKLAHLRSAGITYEQVTEGLPGPPPAQAGRAGPRSA